MAALNENAVGKYKGDLFIRPVGGATWTDIGAVRALVASLDGTSITKIESDNRGTLIQFVDLRASISLTSLETFSRDNLNILFNTTSTNVAGSSTPVVGEVLSSTPIAGGTLKYLSKKNGTGAVATAITVTDGSGVLATPAKYVVGTTADGRTYISFLVATTGTTTVNYTVTPNASETAVMNIGTNELKNFEVKIQAILTGGKARTITLSSAVINSTYSLGFVDVIQAGDVAGAELVFDGNSGSTLTYYDELI